LTGPLPDANAAKTGLSVDVPLKLMLMGLVVCANAEEIDNSAAASQKQCERCFFMG
jgi:hypothetical protein